MANRAQKIEEIKRLLSGEENGQIYFALKDYTSSEQPQPNDLFEATNSHGQQVVKRLCDIKGGKLRAIIWEEFKTYELDPLGGEIIVKDKATAENLKKLHS